MPLVDAVVRDAVEPDLSVRPRLRARPLDAVVEVLGLARGEVVDEARRASAAAGVDAHAGVIVWDPLLRIDHLPVLIEVARSGRHVGVLVHHALPRARVALLERQALGVGTIAQDHRIAALSDGSKYIGLEHQPVVHPDFDVPIDPHAVAHFRARPMRRRSGRFHARASRISSRDDRSQRALRRAVPRRTRAVFSRTAQTAAVSCMACPAEMAFSYTGMVAEKVGVGTPSARAYSPITSMSFCQTLIFIVASS